MIYRPVYVDFCEINSGINTDNPVSKTFQVILKNMITSANTRDLYGFQ